MLKAIIVEDDPMVARLNEIFLEKFKEIKVHKIITNGEDAMKYLSSNEVDLVILDIYMPIVTGIEVLKFIKHHYLNCDVIMITAATETAVLDEILHLGVIDYLVKPFEQERFDIAISNFLSRKKLIHQSDKASQKIIDNILNKKNKRIRLEKGMQQNTLDHVIKAMKTHSDYITCSMLADEINLSKVTARRYLNYLVEAGTVQSKVDYSTGGRPSIKYKLL